jgi:hypothetical protein
MQPKLLQQELQARHKQAWEFGDLQRAGAGFVVGRRRRFGAHAA